MNLFLTGKQVLAMALHTMAEHLAEKFGGAATRHSSCTAKINVAGLDADRLAELRQEVQTSANDLKFDFAFLHRQQCWANFSVLASDMDSTLITIECIDEIAALYGKKAEVAAITEAAMRGDISDFSDSLRRRVALLAGAPESLLHSVYIDRLHLTPGAQALIDAAKSHRLSTLLVSGGFTFFTERLKSRLGIDHAFANQLEINGEQLSGKIAGPIFGSSDKRAALLDVCKNLGVAPSRAIAIGDGANDLPMMAVAGLSVAFHAKPKVAAAADVAISHGGLDVLLEWL